MIKAIEMEMVKKLMLLASTIAILMSNNMKLVMAENYTVGGSNGGWDQSTNLTAWASSITFFPGDNLIFVYTTNHDVTEVSQPDFDACNPNNPLQPPLTGGSTVVTLTSAGSRYFICGTSGHCIGGMKLQIDTLAASAPPPSAPPTLPPSPPAATAPFTPSLPPTPSSALPPEAAASGPTLPPASAPPPSESSLTPPPATPSSAVRFSVVGALTVCSGFFVIMLSNY